MIAGYTYDYIYISISKFARVNTTRLVFWPGKMGRVIASVLRPCTPLFMLWIMYAKLLPVSNIPYRARIFKCLWGPGIDSKEWIPPSYVACMAGRYDKPIPPRFLAPIDFLQIPALDNLSWYRDTQNDADIGN